MLIRNKYMLVLASKTLLEQREKLIEHTKLCISKKTVLQEVNGKNIMLPLGLSYICIEKLISGFKLTCDELIEEFQTKISYNKEKINTTEEKLNFCMYLITEPILGYYKNVHKIVNDYIDNDCKFVTDDGIGKGFLILSMARITALLSFIQELYKVNYKEAIESAKELLNFTCEGEFENEKKL